MKMERLLLKDCIARDVDFRYANLTSAVFCGTDLTNCLFHETNLKNSDFTGAMNYYLDLRHNNISGAKFNRLEALNLLEPLGIELVD